MAYEFTKKKIAAERRALLSRIAVALLMGLLGGAIGAALNGMDTESVVGIFGISMLATIGGFLGFYLAGGK